MKKIVASNFKATHTRKSTKEFIEDVNGYLKVKEITNDVFIFPASTAFQHQQHLILLICKKILQSVHKMLTLQKVVLIQGR